MSPRLTLSMRYRMAARSALCLLIVAVVHQTMARDLYVDNRAGDDRFDGSVATSVDPGAGRFARFPGRCVLPAREIGFYWPTRGERIEKASAWSAVGTAVLLMRRL